MGWTKEEFIDFCTRCGVDPKKALKEGHISLRGPMVSGATIATIRSRQNRKNNAIRAVSKIQDALSKPIEPVALDKEVCEQATGMESSKAGFRISIIGLRVRPIDPDNFCAGCKGLIDGLVESGIISGDDWKTVALTTAQKKVSTWEKEGTLILIETLDSQDFLAMT